MTAESCSSHQSTINKPIINHHIDTPLTPIDHRWHIKMPHNTHTSATVSCNNLPPAPLSPWKTHKHASSAVDTKCKRKKTKPTLIVEQEKKGGRKGKVVKGNKQGKNKCTYAHFIFNTNQILTPSRKTSSAQAIEDSSASSPPAHLTPSVPPPPIYFFFFFF